MNKLLFMLMFVFAAAANANDGWELEMLEDEIMREQSAIASSPAAELVLPEGSSFPHTDIESRIVVLCSESNLLGLQLAGFSFSEDFYPSGEIVNDGVSTFHTRIKWDEEIQHVVLEYDNDDPSLLAFNLLYNILSIEKIKKHSSLLLEIDWQDGEYVYFRYSLSGSSKKIEEAKRHCKG